MTTGHAAVYISVGSNIDPESNIPRAMDLLRQYAAVLAASTFYRTPAIDRPEQPPYLNGVWRIETDLPPRNLKFDVLRAIEDRLGRLRENDKYAARPIDLDILLYGDLVLADADCRIPAPEIRDRVFLQAALVELAPSLMLPDTKKSLVSLVRPEEAATLEPAREFTEFLRSRLHCPPSLPGRD